MKEIQDFLRQSTETGDYDSTGHFELAGAKALEKLSQFAVGRPEHWLLKMVQAGVAGGACEVQVRQNSLWTEVGLDLPKTPTPAELKSALLNPEVSTEPYLAELTTGLRSLLPGHRFEILWRLERLVWYQGQFTHSEAASRSKEPFAIRVFYPGWASMSRAKSQGEQSRLLQQRAVFCSIPVLLDGRQISVRDRRPRSNSTDHGYGSPWNLASGYFGPDATLAEPEVASSNLFRDATRSSQSFMFWPRPDPCVGSFGLFARQNSQGESGQDRFQLLWTRHGVVCAQRTVSTKAGLGGFLQISGDHLRSDLSGLSLKVIDGDLKEGWKQSAVLEKLAIPLKTALGNHGAKTVISDLPFILGKTTAGLCWLALAAIVGLPYIPEALRPVGDRVSPISASLYSRVLALVNLEPD